MRDNVESWVQSNAAFLKDGLSTECVQSEVFHQCPPFKNSPYPAGQKSLNKWLFKAGLTLKNIVHADVL